MLKEAIKNREEIEQSINEYKKNINENIEHQKKHSFITQCISTTNLNFGILKKEHINNYCSCVYESSKDLIVDEHKMTNCKNLLLNDFNAIKDKLSVKEFFIGQSLPHIKFKNKNLSEAEIIPFLECIYETNKKEGDILTTDKLIIKNNYNYNNIKMLNQNIVKLCKNKYINIEL